MPMAMLYIQGFEPIPFTLGVCQLCLEYLLAEFKASAHSADMCPNVWLAWHVLQSIGEALLLANVW